MARTIAPGIVFFLVLVAILGIPATAIGFFNLSSLGLPASIIVSFLAGFLIGTVKRAYFEDNVTTTVVSALIIAFLQFFLVLQAWQVAVVFVIGYLIGRRLEVVEVHDPFHI